jgi:hypothetical protein
MERIPAFEQVASPVAHRLRTTAPLEQNVQAALNFTSISKKTEAEIAKTRSHRHRGHGEIPALARVFSNNLKEEKV